MTVTEALYYCNNMEGNEAVEGGWGGRKQVHGGIPIPTRLWKIAIKTHKKINLGLHLEWQRLNILSKPAVSQEQEEEAGSQAESGLEPGSHVSQKCQTTHSSS